MAEMVGSQGVVISLDVQEKMLSVLSKRAKKRGLQNRMKLHLCDNASLNIEPYIQQVDFVLLFAALHELPDPFSALTQVYQSLKKNGVVLMAEPSNHVRLDDFNKSVETAKKVGLKVHQSLDIPKSNAVLFNQ